MPRITPFQSVRPNPSLADRIAALPYDVYNREEACIEVKKEPLSFLKIDRAETQFDNSVDTYDDRVYEKARETLDEMIADGSFLMDEKPCFYVYELTMNGRSQTGIVAAVPTTYIADGHHRCASAVKVGLKRRKEHPDYTGQEEFNHFLSVLFPDDQLYIMPYNRVVKDLAGMKKEEFLEAVRKAGFTVSYLGDTPFAPEEKGTFGMYLNDGWYRLTADKSLVVDDPVEGLDVSILQNNLLRPILKIADPRTDKRIDFVGGIRGLSELEKRVAEDCTVAFSMYATSIQELLDVADAGLLMPPKSTWFEPKLRSGLFIHRLD